MLCRRSVLNVRCTNNCTQQMPSDQLPSFDALADRFNTFFNSLTGNLTPLAAQLSEFFYSS